MSMAEEMLQNGAFGSALVEMLLTYWLRTHVNLALWS